MPCKLTLRPSLFLGDDLREALEDVLAGRPVQRPMRNSIGCGIKWHPNA